MKNKNIQPVTIIPTSTSSVCTCTFTSSTGTISYCSTCYQVITMTVDLQREHDKPFIYKFELTLIIIIMNQLPSLSNLILFGHPIVFSTYLVSIKYVISQLQQVTLTLTSTLETIIGSLVHWFVIGSLVLHSSLRTLCIAAASSNGSNGNAVTMTTDRGKNTKKDKKDNKKNNEKKVIKYSIPNKNSSFRCLSRQQLHSS